MRWKLVLLGNTSAGKSSLVLRFVRNQYVEYQESTIGAAFLTRKIQLDGKEIIFEIWDTAGQERYHSLIPMYYRGASIGIVAYDITDRFSFDKAKQWVTELRLNNINIIIALSGNKIDLGEDRKVSYEEASTYANSNNLIFIETSSKLNVNVYELFELLAKSLPEKQPKTELIIEEKISHKSSCCIK